MWWSSTFPAPISSPIGTDWAHGLLTRSVKEAREVQLVEMPLSLPAQVGVGEDEVCITSPATEGGSGIDESATMEDEGNFTAETLEEALDKVFAHVSQEEPPINQRTGEPVDINSLSFTELLMSEDFDVLNALFDPAFVFTPTEPNAAPSRMGESEEGFDIDELLLNSCI
jgi:hypothetical protein